MIGTIVNTCSILAGSAVGSLFKKGIKPKYQDALFTAMGLAATGVGINSIAQNMPKSTAPVLFIAALAIGRLLGTVLDIDRHFTAVVDKFSKSGGRLSQGLSTAILLFCVGTLSILGPVESALNQNHTLLFTNAMLDLVTSAVLAATYGFGIAVAAVVLLLWQGGIYLAASFLAPFLSPDFMAELSIVGGFLIFSSGISILKIKEIKTLNMLPSLLVVPLWFLIKGLFA